MVNIMPESLKAASKLKPHRGLGTRLPSLVHLSLLIDDSISVGHGMK